MTCRHLYICVQINVICFYLRNRTRRQCPDLLKNRDVHLDKNKTQMRFYFYIDTRNKLSIGMFILITTHLNFSIKCVHIYKRNRQKKSSLLHNINLTTAYNNMGAVYCQMDEFRRTLWYHDKLLKLAQQLLRSKYRD